MIDLPDFGLLDIKAKVDTGAYTSAIHCSRLKLKSVDGVETLTFYLTGSQIHEKRARKFTTTQFKRKRIRSSNGKAEERYVIKTRLRAFGKLFKVEFSLSDRSKMRYPVLLGRRFLSGKFLVDVSQKDIQEKPKK